MTHSISDLHLPYQVHSYHLNDGSGSDASITDFVKQISEKNPSPEQIKQLQVQDAYFRQGRKYNDAMLITFLENVSVMPRYVAACLLIGSVHGYGFQAAIVQVEGGACFRQSWIEGVTTLATSSIERIGDDLDLQKELLLLRNGSWIFRSVEAVNHNVDQKSGIEGRIATLFIVVGTDAEWLTCSRLLLRGEYPINPLNRILVAVEDMAGKVVLA